MIGSAGAAADRQCRCQCPNRGVRGVRGVAGTVANLAARPDLFERAAAKCDARAERHGVPDAPRLGPDSVGRGESDLLLVLP